MAMEKTCSDLQCSPSGVFTLEALVKVFGSLSPCSVVYTLLYSTTEHYWPPDWSTGKKRPGTR